ncbi:MAG: nucleotidyl transferase AbiEii/AbiGii toxin family protein [Caulobacterales bacterium]|jgi:predicted nucleotidyltransferase component of viral defense system
MTENYRAQVRLLLDVLPFVAEEPSFALKGGTAINLFVRDLPRLSVDIDLTYLPRDDRDTALRAIGAALRRIKARIETALPGARAQLVDQGGGLEVKLLVQRARAQIKIEVNAVLRGHLLPVRQMPSADAVQTTFEAFVEMPVLAHGELFGGKICAALDRQHPRDLFDVQRLLDAEGLTEEVKLGLIVALISHGRPIVELIASAMQDREAAFTTEFAGMTLEPFDYAAHRTTFDRLRAAIFDGLTPIDRAFLVSFEAGDPDWSLFSLMDTQHLPGVQWKLLNIRKLKAANPSKHADGVVQLARALDQHP